MCDILHLYISANSLRLLFFLSFRISFFCSLLSGSGRPIDELPPFGPYLALRFSHNELLSLFPVAKPIFIDSLNEHHFRFDT